MSGRVWGDGLGHSSNGEGRVHDDANWQRKRFPERDHLFQPVWRSPGQEYTYCRCGFKAERVGAVPIESVMSTHLGEEYKPAAHHGERIASDSEVAEFFSRIFDDAGGGDVFRQAPLLRSQSYTRRESAEDRAFDAIVAIIEMGQRCTCTGPKTSRDCPNYLEGDDDE